MDTRQSRRPYKTVKNFLTLSKTDTMQSHNFFQSTVRKNLNETVYGNKIFQAVLLGKNYRGVIKEQKRGPFVFKWFQILGVEFGADLGNLKKLRQELTELKKKLASDRKCLFLQLGIIDPIATFPSEQIKEEQFSETIKKLRCEVEKNITQKLHFLVAFRENLPPSTIVLDLSKSIEQLEAGMNQSCRQRVRKASKHNLFFSIAQKDERDIFYDKWKEISLEKGFHIMGKKTYQKFKEYVVENQIGDLFLAKKGEEIVAGTICIKDHSSLIYLYGAADRHYGNIGGHQFLLHEITKRAKENGYWFFDLFGGAPTGFPDHSLATVSSFKESFGGTKIEYSGSYDLVFNRFLYLVFKLLRVARIPFRFNLKIFTGLQTFGTVEKILERIISFFWKR
ncbi:MAG TPA: peptidoglycan bridge formation glycyltransferase FemA/FemB family protein [Candidatus Absconditabacterales bacterium]|nr:peptidoglycan bridge formation glycyltransferase FemA/FemB family protein [Candidatus Absconditabacterales bacterium]